MPGFLASREEGPDWGFSLTCCGFLHHFPKHPFILSGTLFLLEDVWVGDTEHTQQSEWVNLSFQRCHHNAQ